MVLLVFAPQSRLVSSQPRAPIAQWAQTMRSSSDHTTDVMPVQKEVFDITKSTRAKYQDLVIGRKGLWNLIKYELIALVSTWVPGAVGLFLRSRLYRLLLGNVGRNVIFGMNVVLRHPHKIVIGNNVVIDDNCLLDAKGRNNEGIIIGDGVFVGRNTILSCKNGTIVLGNHVNIGFNCEIVSASRVTVGEKVLIAAYSYLIGADHDFGRTDIPVFEQARTARGIQIDDNVWIGAGVMVTDGVTIGRDSIVGTGSVVARDIPEYGVALGNPARVIKSRKDVHNE